jgi:hypothetical protein
VKKIITVLAIATGLLLTGCSQAENAATLGDVKITKSELQATVDSILAERKKVDISQMQLETGDELNRGQLRFKILMTVFSEIAKELKLEVTPAMITQKRAELIQSIGGEAQLSQNLVNATIAPADFETYLRAMIINSQIGQALLNSGVAEEEVDAKIAQLLSAKATELKVDVNPRYGKWDPASGDIVASNPAGAAVTPTE